MKFEVTLEIKVTEDIYTNYPNFNINYESISDFMYNEIASLNKNISLDETICLKNYHPEFEDNSYVPDDTGYTYMVKKMKELK